MSSKNDKGKAQSEVFHNMVTIHVTKYADAKQIAEAYRDGKTVVVNFSEFKKKDKDWRAIVDFCIGVITVMGGKMECVDNNVLILTQPGMNIKTAN